MNLMTIKYSKSFIKHNDPTFMFKNHCKNSYFWGNGLHIYLHNNMMQHLFTHCFFLKILE
jgi:hypothetical protein